MAEEKHIGLGKGTGLQIQERDLVVGLWAIVFFLYVVADTFITYRGLEAAIAYEFNPLGRSLLTLGGWTLIAGFKLVSFGLALVIWYASVKIYDDSKWFYIGIPGVMVFFQVAVTCWNLYVLYI